MSWENKLRLYVVTDRRLRDEVQTAELALDGGATAIQLRIKNAPTREIIDIGKKIKKLTAEYDALFFINDRVDIALAVDADGVHLGQSDMPPVLAREIAPHLILGVSASNVEEAKRAEREGADYIGAGSVFPTTTKKDAKTIGLETLGNIVANVSVPVVAIGGINLENVIDVLRCGVSGVAMVSAIVGARDIAATTRLIRKILDNFYNDTYLSRKL